MKVKTLVVFLNLLMLISCSKRLMDVNHGLYTNEYYGSYLTEINLLDNNTFCKYYEMECIAMPQMNLGTYEETVDSIIFTRDLIKFLDYNVIIEKNSESNFVEIQPFILIDFLTRNEKWTYGSELIVYFESQGDTIQLAREQFFYPTSKLIKISKNKLDPMKKLIIYDVMLNYQFEIEYDQTINKIFTPTGFLNMNCYERNREKESYGINKYKNKIQLKYTDKYKVNYNLNKTTGNKR